MNLQDIFDQLTYGELSNLSIGGADSGGISDTDKPKIISHLNMAIQQLYVKFNLSEVMEEITITENITEYYISPLVLTGAYTIEGEELSINDSTDPRSVFTPSWNTLQVPVDLGEETIYISYFKEPTKISYTADPDETTVDLPDILLEPLLTYIAGRVHLSLGTTDGIAEGSALMNRFKLLCLTLKNANVLNLTSQNANIKLETRKWL